MKKLLIKELVVEKELENIPYIRENFRCIEEGIADGTLGGGGTGTPGPAGPPGPPGPPGDPASYTDEEAQDAVGNILVDSSTIDFQYDDGTPSITAGVIDGSITNAKIAAGVDAVKISTGIVSNTEFDYLDGLTGNIQTQIDAILNFQHVNQFWVDKNGNDANNGSMLRPFLTVQAAVTAMGTAANTADYEDPAKRYYVINIGTGVYTENVTVGTRNTIVFNFVNSVIVGNVTVSFDKGIAAPATLRQPKFIMRGNDLRSSFTSAQISKTGIEGSLIWSYINGGSSVVCQIHILHSGVTGNIDAQLGAGGTNNPVTQLYLTEAYVTGKFNIITGSGGFFADSCGDDTIGLGGVTGVCRLQMLRNVRFSGTVDVTGTQAGSQWYNTSFFTGSDMVGSSGNISADSNSFVSYSTNVTTKGTETFTYLDQAYGVGYTPLDSSDWNVVPNDVAEALDELANRKDNFSYREVLSGITIEVPSEQQMILVGEPLIVDGVLNIEGSVVLDEFEEPLTYDEVLNFSFKNIVANQSLTIPENQQMLVEDELVVEGELIVEGEISLLYSINEDDYPLYEIPSGVVVNVREYREYFLSDGLELEGVINVEGKLALGA